MDAEEDFSTFTSEDLDGFDEYSKASDHFIIQVNSVEDIPAYGGLIYGHHGEDVMMKSYLSQDLSDGVPTHDKHGKFIAKQVGRISKVCYTTKRFDEGRAVWDTFHNFRLIPPADALITFELYHVSRKSSVNQVEKHFFNHREVADAAHGLIGIAHIPIRDLVTETKAFSFDPDPDNPKRESLNPNFKLSLRRAYADGSVPRRIKTIFLLRHGESRWNLAQEKGQISGLLHRDHPLTEKGINQAKHFNSMWSWYASGQSSIEEIYRMENAGYGDHAVARHILAEKEEEAVKKKQNSMWNTAFRSKDEEGSGSKVKNSSISDKGDYNFESKKLQGAAVREVLKSKQIKAVRVTHSQGTFIRSSPSFLSKKTRTIYKGDKIHVDLSTQKQADNATFVMVYNEPGPSWVALEALEKIHEDEEEETHKTSEKYTTDDHAAINMDKLDLRTSSGALYGNATSDQELGVVPDLDRWSVYDNLSVGDVHKESGRWDQAAKDTRRIKYIKKFLAADCAFSSPLTRAVETALFSLENHPCLLNPPENGGGLHLMSAIREIKGIGGLDTVGKEHGIGLQRRVYDEIMGTVGEVEADKVMQVPLHLHDADVHWWTDINHFEGNLGVEDRTSDFIRSAFYCESATPIFVGHSNFFRYFCSKHLSDAIKVNRPILSSNLEKFRLSNATMLAVTILFEPPREESQVDNTPLSVGAHKVHLGSLDRPRHDRHKAIILDADIIFHDAFTGFANGNDKLD